jgi:periplasmic protein TonB
MMTLGRSVILVAGAAVIAASGSGAQQPTTYFEFQVEKPVRQAPGSAVPRYPDTLRVAKVAGEVVVAFVVDTTGLAEVNSLKILKSTNALFAEAVKVALPDMRFIPAMIGGRKVRQLVQQPFVFAITK